MKYTEPLQQEYNSLYSSCVITPSFISQIDASLGKILANKMRYQKIEQSTGVPWYVVGIIHNLEASLNFSCHLHNGDPLSRKTSNVPRGRPAGDPPFTWEESAVDAIRYDGLDRWEDWQPEGIAYCLEKFNGFGYRHKSIYSPYLWSFSNHYQKGKYVADGKWDANAISQQCGGMTILKRLEEMGQIELGKNRAGATWFQLDRHEDGYPIVQAMHGSAVLEEFEVKDKQVKTLNSFFARHRNARTFGVSKQS
jgi:lysozyme family protein